MAKALHFAVTHLFYPGNGSPFDTTRWACGKTPASGATPESMTKDKGAVTCKLCLKSHWIGAAVYRGRY